MRAIETTATITEAGQLNLAEPLNLTYPHEVRIIVLVPEDEDMEEDSRETIIEGIQEGWQQALNGQTRPVSQLWKSVDVS